MQKKNTQNKLSKYNVIAFMLMVCFVAFQASITYSSFMPATSYANQVDLDLEKNAKEELDKEGEKLIAEFDFSLLFGHEFERSHPSHVHASYPMPHLQVYSPPPEFI